jgi:hypothetical protein
MAKLKVNKRKIGHVPENVFAGYLACFDLPCDGRHSKPSLNQ